MSDPTAYTVGYNFTSWQSLNPSAPLPAARVDIEFANIETALDSLAVSLAQVRRSDGNLQNGTVSWDGLNDDVKARITASDDRVTVADLNPAAFANQAEAESGVANDKIVTPLRARQQLDALRAFASQAQAEAGSATTVVLSPLGGKQMLDALRALASEAEATAGTDNAKVMTPLRGAQQIAGLRPALTATATLTYAEIAAGASSAQSVTLTGAAVNDGVVLGLPAAGVPAGVVAQAWVSSANTVTIRLTNTTAEAVTPTEAQVYRVTAIRF